MKQPDASILPGKIGDDEQFFRSFARWNLIWLVLCVVSMIVMAQQSLAMRSSQLHGRSLLTDWKSIAIILLSFGVVMSYTLGSQLSWLKSIRRWGWPPPPVFAWGMWLFCYGMVVLLTRIDVNFVWAFYATFGLSFALFASPLLFLMVAILSFSFVLTSGLFSLPFDWGNIGGIVGIGFSFFGSAGFSTLMQRLIGERYERNRLLRQLAQSHTELEDAHAQLAASTEQEREIAVLRERTRVAREMHDTLGHALVLVSVKLEAAQRLQKRDPQRSEAELQEVKEIVRSSMNELRASIANLRSPTLEREPVCQALCRYARDVARRTEWQVECDVERESERLPGSIEEALWRIGQEALANIEKHARAEHVLLKLYRRNGHVHLHIQDDGVGLPEELYSSTRSPAEHYGITGMVERCSHLGGHFELQSVPGHGTIVVVDLPLVEEPLSVKNATS